MPITEVNKSLRLGVLSDSYGNECPFKMKEIS